MTETAAPFYLSNDPTPVPGFPSFVPDFSQSAVASVAPQEDISTEQSVWDEVKSGVSALVHHPITSTENMISSGYTKLKGAVGTVVTDIEAPIGDKLQSMYIWLLVGVVVVGVSLYYVGKGGAVKVNAIV